MSLSLPLPNQRHTIFAKTLVLTHFRNYASVKLDLSPEPVVLTGENGAGKTNILEALSFLSPGRGLRGARLHDVDHNHTHPWGVAATISHSDFETHIGTGRDVASASSKRIVKIDGQNTRGQAELSRTVSVMWLTPQMDGIFMSGLSERRKFLDRLVFNFDGDHAARIYSYEHTMRERIKLLQQQGDAAWLTILEQKMAEKSVAIAAARLEALDIIQTAIEDAPTHFPKTDIAADGWTESSLREGKKALEIEEALRKQFEQSRLQDQATGRTSFGATKCDLAVTHRQKNAPAAICSTGEQKAMLFSIILAEARAKAAWKQVAPILLLDEVVAHLDHTRRHALFEEIFALGAQVWMTGTDVQLFDEIRPRAQFLTVKNAIVNPL